MADPINVVRPAAKEECVQVVIRCRPLSTTERENGNEQVVEMDTTLNQSTTQETLFAKTARSIVDSVLAGFNGTVFAYGQTGTGKTFTMEGELQQGDELKGVIPRAFGQVFEQIDVSEDTRFLVRGSFVEIYQDQTFDLLAGDAKRVPLPLKEYPDKGVHVHNLSTFVVQSVEECLNLLEKGKKNRRVGATKMNEGSSRSHCIFSLVVEASDVGADGEAHIRVGKLNMVDLAGSERQAKTESQGVRLKEAAKINLSLSALGNVIHALTSNKRGTHVPYRDSKLTRLLQDSLGGNTKTVMIANVGPADYNYDETISTLRFATRAKSIKNKPRINEDPKDAMLREFQEEIQRLKAALASEGGLGEVMSSLGADAASALGMMMGAGANGQPMVVERVVEKVVERGVSKQRMAQIEEKAAQERAALSDQLEREKEAILEDKARTEAEKQALLDKLTAQQEDISQKREDRSAMRAKLKAIEERLLVGKKIISKSEKDKLRLEKRRAQLERAHLEQERVRQELAERELVHVSLVEKYESQDKELQAKRAKLEKLREKYQEVKQEIEDVQADQQREREELLETIRDLSRHVQLKDMIIANFVPDVEIDKVEARAQWDEENEGWVWMKSDFVAENLTSPAARPISSMAAEVKRKAAADGGNVRGVPPPTRAVTEFARIKRALGDPSPRYKQDNILELELDMPQRTTRDFEGGNASEGVGIAGDGGESGNSPEDDYYRR